MIVAFKDYKILNVYLPLMQLLQYVLQMFACYDLVSRSSPSCLRPSPGDADVQRYTTFSVAIDNAEETSNITGLCEIDDGRIVLVDANNMQIKLLNADYELVDTCTTSPTPLDVTFMSGLGKVVVAIDNAKDRFEIHTVSFTDNFTVSLLFRVSHRCRSISYAGGSLYICSDTSVSKYTPDGKLEKTIYENQNLIMRSVAVSNDASVVYVTDFKKQVLVTIKGTDCEIHNFGLIAPEGVCWSNRSHVYVCGMNSNNVVRISKDGKRKEGTVWRDANRKRQPRAVCLVKRDTVLLISFACDDDMIALPLDVDA
jgi:hypothetical protein